MCFCSSDFDMCESIADRGTLLVRLLGVVTVALAGVP